MPTLSQTARKDGPPSARPNFKIKIPTSAKIGQKWGTLAAADWLTAQEGESIECPTLSPNCAKGWDTHGLLITSVTFPSDYFVFPLFCLC